MMIRNAKFNLGIAKKWMNDNPTYFSLAIIFIPFAIYFMSTTGIKMIRDHATQQASAACFRDGKRGMDLYHSAKTSGEVAEADRVLTDAAHSCNVALGKAK